MPYEKKLHHGLKQVSNQILIQVAMNCHPQLKSVPGASDKECWFHAGPFSFFEVTRSSRFERIE